MRSTIFFYGEKNGEGGFTLVEMMVVIFLFAVMSAITVFNYKDFRNNIEFKNQALEMALVIKEAQTNALASRESSAGSSEFKYAYGVFFDKSLSDAAYVMYINRNGEVDPIDPDNYWFNDGDFDCTVGGECLKRYALAGGYTISELCVPDPGVGACSDNSDVSISYKRPDPVAIIRTENNPAGVNQSSARIGIRSPWGGMIYVHVTKMGQIYVK